MSDKTKLTQTDLENLVVTEEIVQHKTLTIVILELSNGAIVTGESNVIDPDNYVEEVGINIARERAIGKLWELEGYACKTRGFIA